jgi:hypothetical protein
MGSSVCLTLCVVFLSNKILGQESVQCHHSDQQHRMFMILSQVRNYYQRDGARSNTFAEQIFVPITRSNCNSGNFVESVIDFQKFFVPNFA